MTSLLRLLEEVTQDGTGGHGRFGLEACEAAIKRALELAKKLPKGIASEKVEKALNTVSLFYSLFYTKISSFNTDLFYEKLITYALTC